MKKILTIIFLATIVFSGFSSHLYASEKVIKRNFIKEEPQKEEKKLSSLLKIFEHLEDALTKKELKELEEKINKKYPEMSRKEKLDMRNKILAALRIKYKINDISLRLQEKAMKIDPKSIPEYIKRQRILEDKRQKQEIKNKEQKTKNKQEINNPEKNGDFLASLKKNFNLFDLFFYDLKSSSPITGKLGYGKWDKTENLWGRLTSSRTHIGEKSDPLVAIHLYTRKGAVFPWNDSKTSFDWSQSQNVESVNVKKPFPKRFSYEKIDIIGYEDNFIFPVDIKAKDKNKPLILKLKISTPICQLAVCTKKELNLYYKINPGKGLLSPFEPYRKQAIRKIPKYNSPHIKITSYTLKKNGELTINADFSKTIKSVDMFIKTKDDIKFTSPKITTKGKSVIIKTFIQNLEQSKINKKDISIIIKGKHRAVIKNLKINPNQIKNKKNSHNFLAKEAFKNGFYQSIIMFVFLLIAILPIFEFGGQNPKNIRFNFLCICSFEIILAAIISYFVINNPKFQWYGGFISSKSFNIIAVFVFFLFFLNQIGLYKARIFQKTEKLIKNIYSLDKIAPQLKLSQSLIISIALALSILLFATNIFPLNADFDKNNMLVFSSIINYFLGVISPYLLIALFPSIIKPIAQYNKLQNLIKTISNTILFSILCLCIIYLYLNTNIYMTCCILIILAIISFACLMHISFHDFNIDKQRQIKKQNSLMIIINLFIIISICSCFYYLPNIKTEQTNEQWIKYDETMLNTAIKKQIPVFLNVSANWSIISRLNNYLILNNKIAQKKLNSYNAIKMRLTINDKNYKKALKYNQTIPPFNTAFGKLNKYGITHIGYLSLVELEEKLKQVHDLKQHTIFK